MIRHNYRRTLYGIIRELRLTTNLNFVLDAADAGSYDGSSQTWTDATGNGFNFFRGLDGTSSATDPTFAGTAGLPNTGTYFSFDGGDLFKQTAAHSFADNWHKNNGTFTLVAAVYAIDGGASRTVFDTRGATTDGIQLRIASTEVVICDHSVDNTTDEALSSTAAVTAGTWNFIGVSFDEATTAASLFVNSAAEAKTPNASTATDNVPGVIRIGANTDVPGAPMLNGERIGCIAGWSTKLSDANVQEIYKRLKYRRFTSMP